MRKLVATLVIGLALLVLGCAHYTPVQKTEFEQVVESLNTPKKVDEWLWTNFVYDWRIRSFNASLAKGYGQQQHLVMSPIEVYFKKKGVCFDCANFACYVLHQHGYNVKSVYARAFNMPGHVVCAFEEDGKWCEWGHEWGQA